jgi:hypothetical protein
MDVIRPTKEKKKRHVARRTKMATVSEQVARSNKPDKRESEIAQLGLGATRRHSYIFYYLTSM